MCKHVKIHDDIYSIFKLLPTQKSIFQMDGLVLRSVEHCMLSWSKFTNLNAKRITKGSKVVKSKARNIAAIMLISCNQYFRLHSFQAVSVSINYFKIMYNYVYLHSHFTYRSILPHIIIHNYTNIPISLTGISSMLLILGGLDLKLVVILIIYCLCIINSITTKVIINCRIRNIMTIASKTSG